MRFITTIEYDENNVRAVDYTILAVLDETEYLLSPEEWKTLIPLWDEHDGYFVVGTLTATRHASPAFNLTDLEREFQKNPHWSIDLELADRLMCHKDDLPAEIKTASLVGDVAGLIEIHEISVKHAAQGQMVGRHLAAHLKQLHAGLPFFVVGDPAPRFTKTSRSDPAEDTHRITLYYASDSYLNADPIVTCDGTTLLVAYWSSNPDLNPDEASVNVQQILREIREAKIS